MEPLAKSWDVVFRESTQFWVHFVFVPLIVAFGVLGNSLTICILRRKQMRIFSNNIYLTALTLSDLFFLLFFFSLSWRHYECMKSLQLYWVYFPFGLWITDASRSTSVWLTVSFTIERYFAVSHPMLTKYPYTDDRATTVSTIVCPACFILNAAKTFEWKAVAIAPGMEAGTNFTTFIMENTDLGNNLWYRLIYHWFSTITFVLVPFIVLAIGNLFLIHAVRQSQKIREGLISAHVKKHQAQIMRQEDRITIILIVIIIVFFICQLPAAVVLIYSTMNNPAKGSVEQNVVLGLENIFNLFAAINAVSNFILYIAISDKYRQTFVHMLGIKALLEQFYGRNITQVAVVIPKILPVEDKLIYSGTADKVEVNDVIICASCCDFDDYGKDPANTEMHLI